MNQDKFKMRYLGEFKPGPLEVEGKENYPERGLWTAFSRVCEMIGQPCTDVRAEAKPGEWYLTLCTDKNWRIMEKTEEGSKQPYILPGMRPGDLMETFEYVQAFIYQLNKNRTGEEKS